MPTETTAAAAFIASASTVRELLTEAARVRDQARASHPNVAGSLRGLAATLNASAYRKASEALKLLDAPGVVNALRQAHGIDLRPVRQASAKALALHLAALPAL